nr:XRE family transcriptional regulator [Patulibacter sp. SYSU D01012]
MRRLRLARGLSLVDLGRAAGVAKGTLTALEGGRGNPTVETLQALSRALGATLADLVGDVPEPGPRVVRSADGTPAEGWAMPATFVHAAHLGASVAELYRVSWEQGRVHASPPQPPGTMEQVYVLAGTVDVGPEDAPVRLGAGDFARLDGRGPHRYAAVGGPARGLITLLFPALPAGLPPRAPQSAAPHRPPLPPRPGRPTPPQVPVRGVRPGMRPPAGRTPPGRG